MLMLGRLALLLSLLLNAALFFWYIWITPIERMLAKVRIEGALHAAQPVVVLGDSILEVLGAPEGVQNLSVSGATVPWTMREVLPTAIELDPRRVIIGLGINDLRGSASPEQVADRLIELVDQLRATDPAVDITILAILPLARKSALAGETDNAEIALLNSILAEAARQRTFGFVDHSALFSVGGAFSDALTHDGLHPNAAGEEILGRLLFGGLAREMHHDN
jgi:lysophospholipase L1-like esterase